MHGNLIDFMTPQVVADNRAAGTSDYNSSPVDLQTHEGVLFAVPISTGANTGTLIATAQEGASTSSFNALSGTSAAYTATTDTDQSNNVVVLVDVYRPKDRYVRLNVNRGDENVTVGPIVAMPYRPQIAAVAPSTANGVEAYSRTQSPST